MTEINIEKKELTPDALNYAETSLKLLFELEDSKKNNGNYNKFINRIINYYSLLAQQKLKSCLEKNALYFEIETEIEWCNAIASLGWFFIIEIDKKRLHLPWIIYYPEICPTNPSDYSDENKEKIVKLVLEFYINFAFCSGYSEVSMEYDVDDLVTTNVLESLGFNFEFTDDDIDTYTHIATKSLEKIDNDKEVLGSGENEGNNCSRQRKGCN